MLQFAPQRVARQDTEIAADVGDDGTDRAAADLGGDLLGRGQVSQKVVCLMGAPGGRLGSALPRP